MEVSAGSALPAVVHSAREQLFLNGLYFIPIRHHSPACAHALKKLIHEVQPAAVLIEGPDTFTELIPLLLDPQTVPPIAVLAQARGEMANAETSNADCDGIKREKPVCSAFFPFCSYSPELVALQEGAATGAQLAFIDLPWAEQTRFDERDPSGDPETLMAERYLAHSTYVNALAAKEGCRDHDELWDHLFELRPPREIGAWRTFFADVFAYCAMARLDYEPEVLEAEGSLPRERHMGEQIREWRCRVKGPIIIVTGGFHTLELVTQLAAKSASGKAPKKRVGARKGAKSAADQWLIRYSFDRLDALNGYASGMPSPAFYQRVWEALEDDVPDHLTVVAAELLTVMAQATRRQHVSDFISTAHVQAALLQAVRLADLRGHAGPGRQDLLDATFSSFIKGAIDQGTMGLVSDVRKLLGGSRIGDIPPSAGSPPLLEDARQMARRCGIKLEDTTPHISRLDLYRNQKHLVRSRFFHLMAYLGTGLASWQSGPDFLGSRKLDLLFEEWQYAWTPVVEATLIELAARGTTLTEVALARVQSEEAGLAARGESRSAASASTLLVRACIIGLHERLPFLFSLVAEHLDGDASFASVVACGHRLVTLWRAREPLGVQGNPQLEQLLQRVWPAALFLLAELNHVDEAEEAMMVRHLISLRELGRLLLTDGSGESGTDMWLMHQNLSRLAVQSEMAPGISGAAAAILFIDGLWSDPQVEDFLRARFGVGTDPGAAVRCLSGLMTAAPELLTQIPSLLQALNTVVAGWDEATFVSYLPDLRLAFTQLKPQEIAGLAEQIATLTGKRVDDLLHSNYEATETDLLAGARLQLELTEALGRDGLLAWVDELEMS